MESLIQPGWYKSALWHLPYPVKVHSVHEGRVYFTRRWMPHMSICRVESFLGLIVLPDSE